MRQTAMPPCATPPSADPQSGLARLLPNRGVGAVLGSALLLAAAYPPLSWSGLVWVGLVPLLAWLWGARPTQGTALALGWGWGLLLTVYHYAWLPHALITVGGQAPLAATAFMVAGVALLALVPGLCVAGTALAWRRWGALPWLVLPALLALGDALLGVWPWGGLPWGSLAGPPVGSRGAAWVVPLAGGSALVLLVGLVNGAWAAWLCGPRRQRGGLSLGMALPLVVLTGLLAWPAARPQPAGLLRSVPVMLLPSDAPATAEPPAETSDGATAPDERLRAHVARTLAALPGNPPPALIVWPESAAARPVAQGRTLVHLSEWAALWEADLLLGSDVRDHGQWYNAAYLLPRDAFAPRRYDKRKLVPFGEYVPWGFGWLWGRKLTAGNDDYRSGTAAPVLPWRHGPLGIAICAESMLPTHVRRAVLAGAEAVAVLANDQWLTPAAATHHRQLTALQGLAVGRDVIFVANGGWSAHLREGRVLAAAWREGAPFIVPLRLEREATPWVRWGWWPGAGAVALVLLAAWGSAMWRRRAPEAGAGE